jgi:hypothetical protein
MKFSQGADRIETHWEELLLKPAGFVAVLAVLAGGYVFRNWIQHKLIASNTNQAACLELAGSTTTEENGQMYIVGSITSHCDTKYGYVHVGFKIERSDSGENLPQGGMVFAYGRDIQPGETWKFKTDMPIPRNSSYRLDGITAY